jgi:hypothetical protein
MEYILSFWSRLRNALTSINFWTKGMVVLVLSALGIWWPLVFSWKGYDNFFYPEPWFTYGLSTLMIIIGQRLFMKESEDSHSMPNRLILVILALSGCILYGKSVSVYFEAIKNEKVIQDYPLTRYAFWITLLAWLIHNIGINEYDNKNPLNVLGGRAN